MPNNSYSLNDGTLREAKEDLLFKMALAQYAKRESTEIAGEAEDCEGPKPGRDYEKFIVQQINKRNRKDASRKVAVFAGKVFTRVAIVVFCGLLAVSSAMVASAEVRKSVCQLIFTDMEKYMQVEIAQPGEDYIDPDVFTGDDAYAPTYLPEGFALNRETVVNDWSGIVAEYENGNQFLRFEQSPSSVYGEIHVDSEHADRTETVDLNGNDALLNVKSYPLGDVLVTVVWQQDGTVFLIESNIETEEVLSFARGIKQIGT